MIAKQWSQMDVQILTARMELCINCGPKAVREQDVGLKHSSWLYRDKTLQTCAHCTYFSCPASSQDR